MPGIELGAPYWLYTPDQTKYVALNQPTDLNFVGYVDDITGLDDAGVRENAQVTVAGDGGYHGPFWRDRRPWSIAGTYMPTLPTTARSASAQALGYVLNQCLRQDGWLVWTNSDNITRFLRFRKQQPRRDATGTAKVNRTFQIQCVSADWRCYTSGTANSVAATGSSPALSTTSIGDSDAPFTAVITGPIDAPVLVNTTTGKALTFLAVGGSGLIPSGMTAVINLFGTYPTVTRSDGAVLDGYVDPINSDWTIAVGPGIDSWTLNGTGTTSATGLQLNWYDAWA